MPRLFLYSLLACLFALAVGWRSTYGAGDAPSGCEGVFGATSRGGATASVGGGGGCNLLEHSQPVEVEVVRVIDGDTIEISGGRRVRYIGVDTPEVSGNLQYYGPEATSFNKKLVEGRKVALVPDFSEEDAFGRLLRYVYVDGILVNAELVREGYAWAKAHQPDTRYAQCFAALEREALEAKRGIWFRQ